MCDATDLTSIMSLLMIVDLKGSRLEGTKASSGVAAEICARRRALSMVDRGVGIASGMALHPAPTIEPAEIKHMNEVLEDGREKREMERG
jgi:hypothetical protein